VYVLVYQPIPADDGRLQLDHENYFLQISVLQVAGFITVGIRRVPAFVLAIKERELMEVMQK
jgi:hypothetical protein